MAARKVTCISGHMLFDVVSALQKSIRRGQVDDALYWAVEMDLSGFGEYLWRRLRIIASEDVGLGNPGAASEVRALYDNWKEMRNRSNNPERLFLVHAILILCTSAKSRLVDHALIVHYADHDRLYREIPDYAYDKHTTKGRSMGRGVDHFLDEGAKLHPEAGLDDPYKERVRDLQKEGRKPAGAPGEQGRLGVDE